MDSRFRGNDKHNTGMTYCPLRRAILPRKDDSHICTYSLPVTRHNTGQVLCSLISGFLFAPLAMTLNFLHPFRKPSCEQNPL